MTMLVDRAATLTIQDENRKQLGAFLRARRESLDPQRLGLPRSGRRRTPGLRREEVAMLADVGVTWYTRMGGCAVQRGPGDQAWRQQDFFL